LNTFRVCAEHIIVIIDDLIGWARGIPMAQGFGLQVSMLVATRQGSHTAFVFTQGDSKCFLPHAAFLHIPIPEAIILLVKANELSAVLEEAVANFSNFLKWLDFWHATSDSSGADAEALYV
jgi:hypothetical protein